MDEFSVLRRDKLIADLDAAVARQDQEVGGREENRGKEGGVGWPAGSWTDQIPVLPPGFQKAMFRENAALQKASIEREYEVSVTVKDRDDTTSADVETILREVDRRTVESIEFRAGRRGDGLTVELNRNGLYRGAKLRIDSPDQGWAKHAFAQLSDEIGKGEPGYSWIRKQYGMPIVALGSICLIVLAAVLMILPAVSGKGKLEVWEAGGLAVFFASMVLIPSNGIFYDWIAPSFELIGADGQSTGRRRLGSIVGIIGAVIIGIIVNRIYS